MKSGDVHQDLIEANQKWLEHKARVEALESKSLSDDDRKKLELEKTKIQEVQRRVDRVNRLQASYKKL